MKGIDVFGARKKKEGQEFRSLEVREASSSHFKKGFIVSGLGV